MAEEGAIYENSLFTRWQKGDRTPHDRRTILKVILIFAKKGGLQSIREANMFMAATGQRDLVQDEIDLLKPYLFTNPRKQSLSTRKSVKTDEVAVTQRFESQSITKALLENLSTLIYSKFAYWILFLFVFESLWFLRVYKLKMGISVEEILWGMTYGLIAFSSFLYGLFSVRQNRIVKRYADTIVLISLGLLCQFIGLFIWSIYNLNGIKIPYPSLADLGYVGIIPCYILAALRLLIHEEQSFSILIDRKTVLFFVAPLASLLFLYSTYLNSTGTYFNIQIKSLFDFSYPLGEIIPILIAIYLFLSSKGRISPTERANIILLIIAFSVQYLTEYSFIYSVQRKTYMDGEINDFLYSVSYTTMSVVLIAIIRSLKRRQGNESKNLLERSEKSKLDDSYFRFSKA
jgi:fluoride ion exporter CrcB/FEX